MPAIDLHWYGVGYSMRRYYVDEFHQRSVRHWPEQSLVLDLGGDRTSKRGQFDLDAHGFRVVYANLFATKQPQVLADAFSIPFASNTFDALVCSELLEHVSDPRAVVREAQRVLKPGGVALICAPFMYQIHGDPSDYGRYTDAYWRETLTAAGLTIQSIEKQGLYWSVVVDVVRALAADGLGGTSLAERLGRRLLPPIVRVIKEAALALDARPDLRTHAFFSSFTTGFGILALKPGSLE